MIERFFTTTALVYRKQATQPTGTGTYSQGEVQKTSVVGALQPAGAELAEGFALSLSKAFNFWCPLNSDLMIGDTLVIDSKKYKLVGILNYTQAVNNHKECILEINTTQ